MSPSGGEKKPSVWCVWRTSAFATHYSDPVNTYGPFESKEAAEEFAAGNGSGRLYDAANMTFGERESLGIWS